MISPSSEKPKSVSALIMEITEKKISKILSMKNEGSQKAVLANLRKGIGHPPGDIPDLWGDIFADIPEEMFGKNGSSSAEEWAIYSALTMFALHQQGKDIKTQPMHSHDNKIGVAVSKLVQDEDDRPRVARRFNAMATASSMEELTHHLRGIVQLLRAENIPVDYAFLAADLYRYQLPGMAHQVRLIWGQDFYRIRSNNEDMKKGTEDHE